MKGEGCRECEDQFRREVLIDRLVTDSLSTRSAHAVRANKGSYICKKVKTKALKFKVSNENKIMKNHVFRSLRVGVSFIYSFSHFLSH